MKPSSEDDVLDALRDQVLTVGVRRATFAEVSRQTGMSRSTLYRHFPDVESGVAELMTREFTRLLRDAYRGPAVADCGRDQLVAAALAVVELLPEHPLFRRVLDVDPELLLPYIIDRLGGTQRAGLRLVVSFIETGQSDGSIRPGDPHLLAYCLQQTVQSFVLSAQVTERETDAQAVSDELARMLDGYLRPDDGAEDA